MAEGKGNAIRRRTATLTSGRQRPSPGAAGSWDRIGFTNETRSPGSLHPVPLTAAPLAAPNAQVTPAHRTELFPRRFVSHDRSASARALPHRPRTGHRRVCSRRRRCALDESLDESGASALPQHWGDLAVFVGCLGFTGRKTRSAPNRGRSHLQRRDPERRPATAQAAPAPPAATTRAWRTYRKIGPNHAERYLASFAWRSNRRHQLQTMIPRFAHSTARTQPMPYRILIAG